MKKSRHELKEEAEKKLSEAYNLLRVHEKIWQEQWEAAANPFVAIKEHRENTPQRVVLVNAWLQARDTYNKLRD